MIFDLCSTLTKTSKNWSMGKYFVMIVLMSLSFVSVKGQVDLNLTFPDYELQNSRSTYESAFNQYVSARVLIDSYRSQFNITFYEQTKDNVIVNKNLFLNQVSSWERMGPNDVCEVVSVEGFPYRLSFYTDQMNANSFRIQLTSLTLVLVLLLVVLLMIIGHV